MGESMVTEDEISRLALLEAAMAVDASSREADMPQEWATSESAAQWVHDLRQADLARQERLERRLGMCRASADVGDNRPT